MSGIDHFMGDGNVYRGNVIYRVAYLGRVKDQGIGSTNLTFEGNTFYGSTAWAGFIWDATSGGPLNNIVWRRNIFHTVNGAAIASSTAVDPLWNETDNIFWLHAAAVGDHRRRRNVPDGRSAIRQSARGLHRSGALRSRLRRPVALRLLCLLKAASALWGPGRGTGTVRCAAAQVSAVTRPAPGYASTNGLDDPRHVLAGDWVLRSGPAPIR